MGVFVDSVDQMYFLDRFCKSSGEKMGKHVDSFFLLDLKVLLQHGHLQPIECVFVQIPQLLQWLVITIEGEMFAPERLVVEFHPPNSCGHF